MHLETNGGSAALNPFNIDTCTNPYPTPDTAKVKAPTDYELFHPFAVNLENTGDWGQETMNHIKAHIRASTTAERMYLEGRRVDERIRRPLVIEADQALTTEPIRKQVLQTVWDGLTGAAALNTQPLSPTFTRYFHPQADRAYALIQGQNGNGTGLVKLPYENVVTHEIIHALGALSAEINAVMVFPFQVQKTDTGFTLDWKTAHAYCDKISTRIAHLKIFLDPIYVSELDVNNAYELNPEITKRVIKQKPFFHIFRPEIRDWIEKGTIKPGELGAQVGRVLGELINGNYDVVDGKRIRERVFPWEG